MITTMPPAIPAAFQARPALWMMAAAARPTNMQPQTILRAERVAVSLKGKKGEEEEWCWRERLSSMVPAEMRDLESLVLVLVRRLAPLCPLCEVILMMLVRRSQLLTFTVSLPPGQDCFCCSAQPSMGIKADLARSQHSYIGLRESSILTLD